MQAQQQAASFLQHFQLILPFQTKPDGTQVVTFEFIINRDRVEEIIAKKKQKESIERKRIERELKKKKKIADDNHADRDSSCVGHAIFEEEDNQPKGNSKAHKGFKLKIKKETRLIHKKVPPPKKASHSKLKNIAKHSRAQVRCGITFRITNIDYFPKD